MSRETGEDQSSEEARSRHYRDHCCGPVLIQKTLDLRYDSKVENVYMREVKHCRLRN